MPNFRSVATLALVALLAPASLFAQKAAIFDGELLVLLPTDVEPTLLVDELRIVDETETKLTVNKRIAPNLDIWKFTFDHNAIDQERMLATVKAHPEVLVAQFNHKLENRATLPNDPSIGQQWQYVNDGSSGGTVDADLDADDAWDIATGGLTTSGDTIVICVIDDGIETGHPDLAPNLWVNSAEIPNNNIDDDNNGFTDDYLGWNAYDNTDNIEHDFFEDHGTPVAGIVGARGDNNTGVAGVNWNVKLMIVKGGGGEAEALAAYAYPLAFRKLYNQTNGQEGAFVVGTNASWGVDFGTAASAPLWCAMYDSLGNAGILNAGATANNNIDVDVQGDLPTTCPSEYLIGVTNMKRDDVKETFAGFGSTHIDLGAPGEDAYTVEKGSSYAPFGGTSGASPHVAGAIGLLYAAACADISDLAISDPAFVAGMMKTAILDGVDANSSLNGITVTGGRLNLKGAMDELDDICQQITSVPEVTADFGWELFPNPSEGLVTIQIRELPFTAQNAEVQDLTGRRVLVQPLGAQNTTGHQLNLSQLPSGLYFVTLTSNEGQASEPVKLLLE